MARWVLLLISDKLYNFQVLTRGVQSIRQSTKIDLTQPIELGRFLGVGGLGLVANFFIYFYSGLGLVWCGPTDSNIRLTQPNLPIFSIIYSFVLVTTKKFIRL